MLQGKSLGRNNQRVPADFRVNQINFFQDSLLSHSGSYFHIKIFIFLPPNSILIHCEYPLAENGRFCRIAISECKFKWLPINHRNSWEVYR